MNNEVDKNTIDKQCAKIEKKNLLIENKNLIVNCLSTQLLYDVEKSRCLDLEADMSKVHDKKLPILTHSLRSRISNIRFIEKVSMKRENKAPSTLVTRKKQVTFSDKPGTSSSNTQKHEVHQKVQQTNIPVIPYTGVNDSTEASGSKPRSNTKKNKILPTKKENKKEVEAHLRTNKSVWTKVNRVDSSISSKRVVINSNSEFVCKTCNKCLNSASHEMCVVNILNSVNATSTVKIVLNKGKQIWKPKGKLSDNRVFGTITYEVIWISALKAPTIFFLYFVFLDLLEILFVVMSYLWTPLGGECP
ncbi:hypothetical protein Tco_0129087 [Tanacetum coccineum]